MVFRMLAVLAEFERDVAPERTTAALAHKHANGQRTGTVPYGFDLADDGGMLIPNESERFVIADIRSMRRRGVKLASIAVALTERSVPTNTRRFDAWSAQSAWRILKRSA